MKKLFLLLALCGMVAVDCTEGGVDDNIDNGGNNTEQPGEDDDDENKEDETTFITDSEGNVVVKAEGGEVVVTVTTDIEYSVEIPEEAQSWLSVADTRTIRMDKLTFTVADNNTFEERSADVELVDSKGKSLQTINFTQLAKSNVMANNEIWYTTTDNKRIILPSTEPTVFGAYFISNTYSDGKGVLTFDGEITKIGNDAFKDIGNLASITIPDSVTSIGSNPFYGCSNLTSITIPDSVKSIGSEAFCNCTWLTSITIGNGVTEIGKNAFSGCTGELIVNCNIPSASTYFEGAFYGSKFTRVTIGDSVTSIGDGAFTRCDSLTSITIPDSVTSIGVSVFYECFSLESVTIPDSVTSIGDEAFRGCTSLTSVTIGNSVTSIGDYAFHYCTSLTSVYITDITAWCEISFGNYSSNPLCYAENLYLNNELVTDLIIPDSVTLIGDYAFRDCDSLTSVTIPDSVTSIGNDAFNYCDSLTSVYITDIAAWCNISFGNGPSNPLSYAGNLYLNNELVTDLIIPDSVTSIGYVAFLGCTSLTSVTIPDSVTSIGDSAFRYCTSLTSVTIPDSVTSIGDDAFYYCYSLKEVYCKPTTPPTGGSSMFGYNASDRTIYVPSNSVSAYKSASGWSSYASAIVGYDF